MPYAGNQTCTSCPGNSTTTSTARTMVVECECDAGYMDSSTYTICSSANPCQKSGFCTLEYGGGEGVCFLCEDVSKDGMSGARCCAAFTREQDIVQACFAACGGTEPGSSCSSCEPGKTGAYRPYCVECPVGKYNSVYGSSSCLNCPANTYTGMSYCSANRQGSQIVHLVSSYYNPHTTHTTYR